MKKILTTTSLFLFAFMMILCFPIDAKADEDLMIPTWVVEADLQETGDLHIVEDLTFQFNSDFNGVFREIILEKTSGVSDIQVEEIIGNASAEYTQVEDAKKGDQGVYLVKDDSGKITIQIFSPSEDQEKTFRISYAVKNVATKYNDTGELYYKFLGSENDTPIGLFTVNIKLPNNDTNNEVKVFAHGPLNGEIERKGDNIFTLHVNNVPSDTFIEGRLLFPREFIPLSNNIVTKDNYNNILEEEASYAEQIEEDLARKKAIRNTLEQASILTSILGLVIFILFLILFRREKGGFQTNDFTKIPEDCTPAVACYLTSTIISSNTIIATLLDLFRKGYIKIDQAGDNKEEDYIISKIKESDTALLSHEKHFMHWFIDKIGNKSYVSSQEIEAFSENHSTTFQDLYQKWNKKIKEDAIQKGYFDKSKAKYGTLLLILFIPLLVLGISTLVYGSLFGLASLFTSIFLLIYGILLFYRRSDYGYEQYKKWMEFKKYIKKMKKNSSPDHLDKYSLDISLIYSLALSVSEAIDALNINTKNNQDDPYYNNNWIFWYFLFRNNRNNAFEKSINNAMENTGSSSSGGGGFSVGGGGGAGGGGAGGF